MICDAVIETNPEFEGLLVPLCVYRGGKCDEFNPCPLHKDIKSKEVVEYILNNHQTQSDPLTDALKDALKRKG